MWGKPRKRVKGRPRRPIVALRSRSRRFRGRVFPKSTPRPFTEGLTANVGRRGTRSAPDRSGGERWADPSAAWSSVARSRAGGRASACWQSRSARGWSFLYVVLVQRVASAVPALLSLSLFGFGCAASTAKAESRSTPVVVVPVPGAGALPSASLPAALRVRACRIETSSRGVITTTGHLTFGADAAGNVGDIHVVAGDTTVTIDRSYDASNRFMSERRRVISPSGETRTTFTWRRDHAGHVTYAERAEETRGGASPPVGRLIMTTVTAPTTPLGGSHREFEATD